MRAKLDGSLHHTLLAPDRNLWESKSVSEVLDIACPVRNPLGRQPRKGMQMNTYRFTAWNNHGEAGLGPDEDVPEVNGRSVREEFKAANDEAARKQAQKIMSEKRLGVLESPTLLRVDVVEKTTEIPL